MQWYLQILKYRIYEKNCVKLELRLNIEKPKAHDIRARFSCKSNHQNTLNTHSTLFYRIYREKKEKVPLSENKNKIFDLYLSLPSCLLSYNYANQKLLQILQQNLNKPVNSVNYLQNQSRSVLHTGHFNQILAKPVKSVKYLHNQSRSVLQTCQILAKPAKEVKYLQNQSRSVLQTSQILVKPVKGCSANQS